MNCLVGFELFFIRIVFPMIVLLVVPWKLNINKFGFFGKLHQQLLVILIYTVSWVGLQWLDDWIKQSTPWTSSHLGQITIIPKSELSGFLGDFLTNPILGGFNPFEKYARQIGSSPQLRLKTKNLWSHHLETNIWGNLHWGRLAQKSNLKVFEAMLRGDRFHR